MMKTTFTLLQILFASTLYLQAQETVLAGWTFPGNLALADTGIFENLDKEIMTLGETSVIEFKNGIETKAAQASAWNGGAGEKAWVVQINAEGYSGLTISSRQQSGGNDPGPKNFMLEYSLDGVNWVAIENGEIMVENDWETSFVDQLPLPQACSDQPVVNIRWLMVDEEASGAGGAVLESGKSKIDEIFVRGENTNSIKQQDIPSLRVFVNNGHLEIHSEKEIEFISLLSLDGRNQHYKSPGERVISLDVSDIRSCRIVIYAVRWKNSLQHYSGKVYLP